jgi:hypothetical protein
LSTSVSKRTLPPTRLIAGATRRPHLLYDMFYRWCRDTTKEPQLADQQDEAVTNRSEGQQS